MIEKRMELTGKMIAFTVFWGVAIYFLWGYGIKLILGLLFWSMANNIDQSARKEKHGE